MYVIKRNQENDEADNTLLEEDSQSVSRRLSQKQQNQYKNFRYSEEDAIGSTSVEIETLKVSTKDVVQASSSEQQNQKGSEAESFLRHKHNTDNIPYEERETQLVENRYVPSSIPASFGKSKKMPDFQEENSSLVSKLEHFDRILSKLNRYVEETAILDFTSEEYGKLIRNLQDDITDVAMTDSEGQFDVENKKSTVLNKLHSTILLFQDKQRTKGDNENASRSDVQKMSDVKLTTAEN